ncbi:MAG: hypothetical protein R3C10_12200 [Pirellulales bacterium]
MNDTARAISILRQARDILSERLVHHVNEHQEALLADALGLDFSGEIDSLYEQIGARLAHINTMLSQLPAQPTSATDAGEDVITASEFRAHAAYIHSTTATVGLLAAPEHGGDMSVAVEATMSGPLSWEALVSQIRGRDVDSGAALLADYLDIDVALATSCTATFHRRVDAAPQLFAKAMQLSGELRVGSVNASIMLLWECFGLQGSDAVNAAHTLRARLASP